VIAEAPLIPTVTETHVALSYENSYYPEAVGATGGSCLGGIRLEGEIGIKRRMDRKD